MQALSLIARGFTDRDIAALLAISLSTARKHRENLQRKLQLRKSAQLTVYYLEHCADFGKKNRQTPAHNSASASCRSFICWLRA